MRVLRLGDLAAYLQALLDSDPVLNEVWVEGEVSNFSRAASGHCYFTLKDADAQLKAACFRSYAARIAQMPRNGEQVLAHGRVAYYSNGGQIQLYVDMLRPAGAGLLNARFEELKARLSAEGLFDAGRKRPLPTLPRRIGVVTSAGGAAWRDILTVFRRRNPLLELVLAPCLVQGDQAPSSIVEALYGLYELPDVDMIIVARGGGSIEDLWAFNDETVARAAFASPVPLLSGVGHETDTTIIDYVSDLRAPTPSAAAELAAPPIALLADTLASARSNLAAAALTAIDARRSTLDAFESRLARRSPQARLDLQRQHLDAALRRAQAALVHRVALAQAELGSLRARLATLDPAATLERGYALVTRRSDGRLVNDPALLDPGEAIEVQVRGGSFGAVRA